MGICSKDKATDVEQVDGFEGRYADLGGYTVGWESFEDAMDPAELFVGLPDDACQSPHWGVVLSGAITFRYTDGTTEVAEAGQAYYAHPGHVPSIAGGTSLIEFSPTDDLAKTMEVVMRNAQAAAEGAR